MPTIPDRALVQRARRGETEAYGQLVRTYQTSVFNVCYRLMDERREAEDMAQEAFTRAYQRLHTFDPQRPFGPWIRRIAANVCINRLNRKAPLTVPLNPDLDAAPSATNPETAYGHTEKAARLRAALLTLPPHYRSAM